MFGILRSAAREFGPEGLTVRAAGGWVRDKLLGNESNDIDIVVDKVSGEQFAHMVSDYMAAIHQDGCSRISVVRENPKQSKHLATAAFSLFGISLDANRLRIETYMPESRIPQIAIGTPGEDAYRRDFTINSLFYNLRTQEVEDHVGTGLQDIRSGLIRTPLPPLDTFEDDPLRVLRVIRFAMCLGFEVDEEVFRAARQANVAKLLETKVSRERIGIELEKIFRPGHGPPSNALALMARLGIMGPVFMPAELTTAQATDGGEPAKASDLLVGIERVRSTLELLGPMARGREGRLAAYAALLSPWWSLRYREKRKLRPLVHGVLRHGLRLSADISEMASAVVETAVGLMPILGFKVAPEEAELRLLAARRLLAVKEHWPIALALAVAMSHGSDKSAMRSDFCDTRDWLEASGLPGCWEWRPFFDGKQLMQFPFNVPKGKRLGRLIEAQLRWRMEDPSLDAATCERRLLAQL